MSCTKLHCFNQVYEALITPSSENAQFPASNLLDNRRTKVFRSLSGNDSIVFDFGEAVPISTFLIVSNPRYGWGVDKVTIELNGSNAWGSPVVSLEVPLDPKYGFGFIEFDQKYNLRYARIVMESVQDYCEISKVYIGDYQDLGEVDFGYPLDHKIETNAVMTKNRYGQRFVDLIGTQKFLGASIDTMTSEEADSILELLDFCGVVKPVWLRIEQTNITLNQNRLNGYYFLQSVPEAKFNTGNYWSIPINLEEGL